MLPTRASRVHSPNTICHRRKSHWHRKLRAKKGSDAAEEEERSRRKTAALLPARFCLLERKVRSGKK